MDAQAQAKILKKPNVQFATGEPEPNQIQPILDGLQKVLQNQNQNQKPDVKTGEAKAPAMGIQKRKGLSHQVLGQVNTQIPCRDLTDVLAMKKGDTESIRSR